MIEGALWGNPPERAGGMVKKMDTIEKTLTEVRTWIRAIAFAALIYFLLFGPDQVKELIRVFHKG